MTRRLLVAAATALVLCLGVAAPAQAETWRHGDAGDRTYRLDIQWGRVVNPGDGGQRIDVRIAVREIHRKDASWINVLTGTGVQVQVVKNVGGPVYFSRSSGGVMRPRTCHGLRVDVRFGTDVVRYSIPRQCFKTKTARVRWNGGVENRADTMLDNIPGRGFDDPFSRWIHRG